MVAPFGLELLRAERLLVSRYFGINRLPFRIAQPAHHFCIEHLKKLDSFVKKLPYEGV